MNNIRYFIKFNIHIFVAAVCAVFFVAPIVQAEDVPLAPTEASQSAVSTNLGLYGGDNWDIAVDGNYVYAIASGTPNGFFYSTDSGANWQRPSGTYDYGSGQSVDVDPATGAVYVGLGGDVYKSTDHGATLTLIESNGGNPLLFAHGRIYAVWNNTIKISADNGATWTSSEVTAAGNIWSLAASKTTDVLYVTTYSNDTQVGTLSKSIDAGLTWTAQTVNVSGSPITGFTTVRANPYDANTIVVADDHHLWLSTDGGISFAAVSAAASCNTIATWTSAGRMYACSSYSDDSGATWTAMNFSAIVRGPGKVIVVDSANEQILYADSMSGVTKSTDGGVTWANSYKGITGVNIQAISVTSKKDVAWVSSGNGLAKSTNFNTATPTWEFPILPCAVERCDPSGIGASVWVKPDDSNIVLAGSIGGYIFRSTDGGTTWALASIPSINVSKFIDAESGMNNLRPYQIMSDPNNASIVYATMAAPTTGTEWIGTVLKSTDSGLTWTDLGIPSDAPANAIAMSKSGTLYVGVGYNNTTTKTLYKYVGSAWTELPGTPTDANIKSILVDPENDTTLYITAAGDAVHANDGFYKSSDSGATWKKIAGLASYFDFAGISVQKSTTPNTLYISCRDSDWHGVLLKSSDAGETWGVLYKGLKSETFNSVVFDGLMLGSKRGVFSLKSKALFKSLTGAKVAKGKTVSLTAQLRDKATSKNLRSKKVLLYRLDGKKWVLYKTGTTDQKGKITFKVKASKTKQYHMTWKPTTKDSAEYTKVDSKNVTVTVKK